MQIIGHKLIDFEPFNLVNKFDASLNNVIFKYDESLVELYKQNRADFSIICSSIKEILLSNAFEAKFIIPKDTTLAKKAQKLANEYLFDSKIAFIINDLNLIEKLSEFEIDAVILNSALR
ncbi:MAG: hypothetical protein MR902_06700 [Campylobacter sp.]|nr:hypothetical protein [Campylobacter sp.]